MGEFDGPPGDPDALSTAATGLGTLSNDLHERSTGVTKACQQAVSDWKGKRATDFKRATLTVEDEVSQAESVMQQAAAALSTYATALRTAQQAAATAATAASTAQTNAENQSRQDPANAHDYHRGAAAAADKAANDAADARSAARTAAQQLAATLDGLTRQIVAKGTKLDPADLKRAVDTTMGGSPVTVGPYANDALFALFGRVEGAAFQNAPKPGSPTFAGWFAGLSPLQKMLAMQNLNSQFSAKGFNPYATIKPGQLPPWAVAFNNKYATVCTEAMPGGQGPYGYFGGGTVMGPGGVQWPIVMPYVTGPDGHVYMNEDGPIGPEGGIDQLDGKDAGWKTVAQYTGVNQYGTVKPTTNLIVFGEIATGQELETNRTDPGAVQLDSQGRPYAGSDANHVPAPFGDKPYWDVENPRILPTGQRSTFETKPDERYEITKGSAILGLQAMQGGSAVSDVDSHAQRRYFIDYQVNDDGRTRAVVHTYTSGVNEEGKTVVGSFANGFPDGKGSTNEIAYNTRHNPFSGPTSGPVPDHDVEYTGYDPDDPTDTSKPINDPLNR